MVSDNKFVNLIEHPFYTMNCFSLTVHMIFLLLCLSTVCYASKMCYVSLIVLYLEVSKLVLVVKNLPANARVIRPSVGQEDPLEESMANHSNILAWRIPRTEETCGLEFTGLQRIKHDRSNLARHDILCTWS